MTDLAWRYDWQAAPEGLIQKWLLPTILSPDQTAGLSDATNRFTDVTLTIQVNGVEVSARKRSAVSTSAIRRPRRTANEPTSWLGHRIGSATAWARAACG